MTFSLQAKPVASQSEVSSEAETPVYIDFSLDQGRFEQNGYAVYPNSLLFRAGDYKDKKFKASNADLAEMAAQWTPVKGNIEHKQFGRGRAGLIDKVWTEEGDSILRGEVRIPLSLDTFLTDQERKVSLEINPRTKTAVAFALTTDPRVDDAVLMSATSTESTATKKHDTPHGQRGMQDLHDTAVRYGAVCDSDNAVARFASAHENEAIQAAHDMACEHGAKCDKVRKEQPTRPSYLYYSKDRKNPDPAGRTAPRKGANKMSKPTLGSKIKSALTVLFGKAGMPESEIDEAMEEIDFSDLEAHSEQLDATSQRVLVELSKTRQKLREQEANAWANQMVTDQRALPTEVPAMVAAYLFAAEDDEKNPATITFAQGEATVQASRLDIVKTMFSKRASHNLFNEMLKTPEGLEEAQVLFSKAETARQGERKPMSEERKKKLIGMTQVGRAALKK